MSALDPLAAIVAGNADLTALVDAELAALAADAQALRGLLVEGAVVTARVLPSNGLTDLLEIAGRRVAASLPPTVRPGDVLQVQVSGFDGERILLQVVGTGDGAAVEPGPPGRPLAADAGAFVAASVVPAPGGTPASPPPTGATAAVSPATANAPAGRVAVAAGSSAVTGRAVAPNVAPPAAAPSRLGVGPEFVSVVSRANVAPSQAGGEPAAPAQTAATAARQAVIVRGEPTSIEARVAAAVVQRAPLRDAVPVSSAITAAETARPPSTAQAAATAPAMRFVAPPHIAPKTSAPGGSVSASGAAHAAPRAAGLAAYAEPVALLRGLRLPVTPSNVASAALALERPERLPAALAALERALPRASDDPHVATLRTLLAFVGRIDPRSPVLATQLAAYVDHVADGAEPKLATLVAASQAAGDRTERTGTNRSSAGAPDADAPPTIASALAAERGTALSADLKQNLLALAANPATPESLAPSLAGALTALTAVQVNAAQALAANPNGIAFAVPLVTPHGTSTARISVQRDAPHGRGARADAANFRIAFVLDTAHYGTVAIDLITVGREVTVDVRTEAAPAMRAFRDALGALTARLESLRYRVASAGASVGTTSTVALEAPPSRPVDPEAAVDRSA